LQRRVRLVGGWDIHHQRNVVARAGLLDEGADGLRAGGLHRRQRPGPLVVGLALWHVGLADRVDRRHAAGIAVANSQRKNSPPRSSRSCSFSRTTGCPAASSARSRASVGTSIAPSSSSATNTRSSP